MPEDRPRTQGPDGIAMRRVLLFVLLVGAALGLLGLLFLGAFPPKPHIEPVRHVIPADRIPVPAP